MRKLKLIVVLFLLIMAIAGTGIVSGGTDVSITHNVTDHLVDHGVSVRSVTTEYGNSVESIDFNYYAQHITWLSGSNADLPGLKQMFYKGIVSSNDTTMPIHFQVPMYWYKASDGLKQHPIATAVVTGDYEHGTTNYMSLSWYFTQQFTLSNLTGGAEYFNVSGGPLYNLSIPVKQGTPNATQTPFTSTFVSGGNLWYLTISSAADSYWYSDYENNVEWDLAVSYTENLDPFTVMLAPVGGTNAINYYAHHGNSTSDTLMKTITNMGFGQNLTHGFNPLTIHINSSSSPGFSFTRTYDNRNLSTPTEIPGIYNVTFHVITRSGQDVPNAHVSFMYDNSHAYGGTVSGYTNNTGMISFGAVPGAAAAVVDVTASGYPEYIETFTLNHDMVKTITLASPTLNLFLDVYESQTGAYLDGVNIGIKNTSSGVWRNTTDHSGAAYFDSTGANYEYPLSINETVIVEAHKAGYLSDWKSVTIPYDRYRVALHLSNINGTQPTSGNFTAVIAIGSATTGLEIPGGSITIQELGRMSATNMAGVATFRDLPVGTYTALGSASGYQSSMTTITGTDQETVMTRIRLLPNGCSIGEGGIVKCQNETYGITPTPGNLTPNEKAAGGLTAFLDNITTIGLIVVLGICIWAGKKVILG